MVMAISRVTVLYSSGLGFCHGEFWDGNATSRNVRLPKAQLAQRRVVRRTVISSQFRDSSRCGESECLHSHGVRAQAEYCGRGEIGVASLGFLLFTLSTNKSDAAQTGGLDKYLKRKKLDCVDTYVPSVLRAQSQFQEFDGIFGGEQKTYADARSLLWLVLPHLFGRIFVLLLSNAAEAGTDDGVASAAVDLCLSALEDLDSLSIQASIY